MYADKATEQKLVSAIKEAAQRIDYSSTPDPEAVLAECLTKHGLSDGFAKTAATALNKSYSVYYMSTHGDDTRGNDHPLLDSEKVKMHMCKESTPVCPHTYEPKEDTPDVKVRRVSTVEKSASVQEETHTIRTFSSMEDKLNWLSDNMLKMARSYEEFTADTNMALETLYNRHKSLRDSDLDDYTVQCLYKQGNESLNEFMDTLGLSRTVEKTAMLGTSRKSTIRPMVPSNDTSNGILSLYRDASIVKTATKSVQYMKKHLDILNEGLQDAINKYDKDCIMGKYAAADAGSAAVNLLMDTGSIPAQMAIGSVGGVTGGLYNVIENLQKIKDGKEVSYSNVSVIDPVLLTEDRRVKNLEALSEVLADRNLSRYSIPELFEVTQKLIKANPQFERPDMAPMLVDTVSQVMSQGGQVGLALHGATAKTIGDIVRSRTNVTGNDLYDIRAGITGSHTKPTYDVKPADLFLNGAVTGLGYAEQGIGQINEAVRNYANQGYTFFKERNKRKIEKLKEEVEIAKLKKERKESEDPAVTERKRMRQEIEDAKLTKEYEDINREPTADEKERKNRKHQIEDMEQENKLNRLKSERDRREIESSELADQLNMLKNDPGKAEKLLNAMSMANSNIAISGGKVTGYNGDVIRADNSKLDTSTLADVIKSLPSVSAEDISISGSKGPSTPTIGVSDSGLIPVTPNSGSGEVRTAKMVGARKMSDTEVVYDWKPKYDRFIRASANEYMKENPGVTYRDAYKVVADLYNKEPHNAYLLERYKDLV